jgi:hypothetical protein
MIIKKKKKEFEYGETKIWIEEKRVRYMFCVDRESEICTYTYTPTNNLSLSLRPRIEMMILLFYSSLVHVVE